MQDEDYVYVYFDLDHFKAFNDHYGFRQGDRVIVLFSDILKGAAHGRQLFIGHIGGDDFFAGLRAGGGELPSFLSEIRSILDKFSRDVTSFYKPEDRERGSIRARDRSGAEQDIPLLTVSAAVLFVPAGPRRLSLESLGEVIANVKERAKESPDHLALTSLTEEAGAAWAEGPEDLFLPGVARSFS
jgi:GGDEF domain-containing protein